MAQQVDGTIYINTLIDSAGFKVGGKEIEAGVKRMIKSVSGIGSTAKTALQKQTDAFVKQNQAYAQQEQKVEALKQKLAEMSNQKVATDEFKEIGKQIDNDNIKLNRLEKAQEEFLAIGGKENSTAYKRREIQIEELRKSIQYAKSEQEDLLNNGGAYKTVDTSNIEQKLFSEQQRLQQMNNSLSTSFESLKEKIISYGGTAEGIVGRVKNAFSNLFQSAKSATKVIGGTLLSGLKKVSVAMLGLHKNTKKSNGSFGSSLKTMLKYGLGIRSVFVLVNRLRRALVDGFKNLAQYDNRINASISSLMSALTQLKNSFATAFAPILNVVAPILTTFINMISRAVTYVGMLIAALTGKGTFVKAVGLQQDYAESLENSAGAAKDAEKATSDYLSGLDEIRKFEEPDKESSGGSGGGGGGVSAQDMFEEVPIESNLKNLADKMKSVFTGIFDVFKKAWDSKGQSVVDAAKGAFQTLKSTIYDIGTTWFSVWTNGTGQVYIESVLNLVRSILGVVKAISDAFKTAWNDDGNGFALITSFYTMWTNIYNLLAAIKDSFSRVFSNGTGAAVLSNILQIVTQIYNTFCNIAGQILIAWQNAGIGDDIWQGILNIVISILTFINNIITTTANWAASLNLLPLLESVSELLQSLSPLIQTIGNWLTNIYNNIILPIASYLIETALPRIISVVSDFLNFLSEHQWIIEAIGAVLLGAFAASKIVPLITAIMGAVSKFIILLTGTGGLKGVISAIAYMLGPTGVLAVAITAAIAILVLLVTHWDKVKAVMQKFDQWISGVFSHDWTKEFGILGNIINGFFSGVSQIWRGIKEVFSGIITFITGVFSGDWKKAWEGIKKIFKGVFDALIGFAKTPINTIIGFINGLISGVVSGVNSMIRALNRLHFSIPKWVPGLGGHSFGFNLSTVSAPQIPYLATGAVIPPNAPFMAMLGDQKNGNNLEMPENLLRKIIREETGGQQQRGNVTYRFTGQINRRTLFDEMMTEAQLVRSQTGINPFEMA